MQILLVRMANCAVLLFGNAISVLN
eukprot:COSAG02_NODE_63275_length_263_cov_1.237805_1_plen_24_part_01